MAAKSTLSKPKLDAARKQANGNPIKLHPIKQLAIVKNAKATVHFSEPAKTTWGRRINLILRPFFIIAIVVCNIRKVYDFSNFQENRDECSQFNDDFQNQSPTILAVVRDHRGPTL